MDKFFITLPGEVGYVPPTVWLLFVAVILAIVWQLKRPKKKIIDYKFLLFILGSTIPLLDDWLALAIGSPFSHHSLFHSLVGLVLVFIFVQFIWRLPGGRWLVLGQLTHIIFNFVIDFVPLFFPFTVFEFSLSQWLPLTSAQVKIFIYPVIILLFLRAAYFYLKSQIRYAKQ